MRVSVLVVAAVLSSSAIADSCVTMDGSTVINRCQACMELTFRALSPPSEQAAGIFTGEPRSVRIEAGGRAILQGSDRWAITDLKTCRDH